MRERWGRGGGGLGEKRGYEEIEVGGGGGGAGREKRSTER